MRMDPCLLTGFVGYRSAMMYDNKGVGKPKIHMRQGLPYSFFIGDLLLTGMKDMIDLLIHVFELWMIRATIALLLWLQINKLA